MSTESKVAESTILLARALVAAATREGRREAADIEAIADLPLQEDASREPAA